MPDLTDTDHFKFFGLALSSWSLQFICVKIYSFFSVWHLRDRTETLPLPGHLTQPFYWPLFVWGFFHISCTKILTKIHPNYRWITGETDMEFQFSSWNWQGDGILAKIQVVLPKDSMWIFLIPAGNFQAHGISFSGFIHLECYLIVFKNPPGNS